MIDDEYISQEFVIKIEKENLGVILHLMNPENIKLKNMQEFKILSSYEYGSLSSSRKNYKIKSKSKQCKFK